MQPRKMLFSVAIYNGHVLPECPQCSHTLFLCVKLLQDDKSMFSPNSNSHLKRHQTANAMLPRVVSSLPSTVDNDSGDIKMSNLKNQCLWSVLVLTVLFGLPLTSLASTITPPVIVGDQHATPNFKAHLSKNKVIKVVPFFPTIPGRFEVPEVKYSSTDVIRLLNETHATGLWSRGKNFDFVRLIPFEVKVEKSSEAWERVTKGLWKADSYTFVNFGAQTRVTKGLSLAELESTWNKAFSKYKTIRTLGIANVVYILPIRNDAVSRRYALLKLYGNELGNFVRNPTPKEENKKLIDDIFYKLFLSQAQSDQLAMLNTVWITDIRKLFKTTHWNPNEATRSAKFVVATIRALKKSERYCNVVVSTSKPGAVVQAYKSVVGSTQSKDIGTTNLTYYLERATWTFESYRMKGGNRVRTGQRKNVALTDRKKDTFVVTIFENE